MSTLELILKTYFKNPPPIVTMSYIMTITDKQVLARLEAIYDTFIIENQQLLTLRDIIEDMLDIRDALLLRIGRLIRLEQKILQ
jgi:hypothetical protein